MNNPIHYRAHHDNIHSIVIANEILEYIITNTTQIGMVYRYDTKSRIVNPLTRIRRHEIATVQKKNMWMPEKQRRTFSVATRSIILTSTSACFPKQHRYVLADVQLAIDESNVV